MSESKLIELGYYDPSAKIRLSAYADIRILLPMRENMGSWSSTELPTM